MEKKFRKTFEKMEGFSYVTHLTGLNRPNTGKKDDDECLSSIHMAEGRERWRALVNRC
jgi:hypothetical protein